MMGVVASNQRLSSIRNLKAMSRNYSMVLYAGACAALMALPFAAGAAAGADDAYRPPVENYDTGGAPQSDGSEPPPYESEYTPENGPNPRDRPRGDTYSRNTPPPPADGYGEPYAAPENSPPPVGYDEAQRQNPGYGRGYEQGEIIGAGHKFFGGITSGLANAVEYAFKSQGRPNGYILGEDAGGALIVGLRYGEGTLHTKETGNHKVFWQGPSIGYDAGAEGSKTLVLVYNMRDPAEIYERFGGVQGSAYLIGGVSVQFQKYNDVTLAVIRSGLGLRLGANIGYMKYSREPTWNPL
jgi:hypothetical protein